MSARRSVPRLTRTLVLEAPQTVPDGMGGRTDIWVVLGTLWADMRARSGREARGLSGSVSDTGYRITVRAAAHGAPSRPQAGHRFREGARVFRIEAVTEADADVRFLTCFASEEVTP